MLHVAVVTLFPEMLDALTGHGITGRAIACGLVRLEAENPRDYTHDRHRTVDDRPYGGGPGMVMLVEPLRAALDAARRRLGGDATAVYLTPQGRRLDQAGVERLLAKRRLALVCGRYEGVDERFVERDIDLEVSVGDYVLAGGELPAMVLIEAMTRLLPGALGHQDSARDDSFAAGGLLDCPHYSRPEAVDGRRVPAVLLSGDHAAVRRWRRKQALGRTWLRRPDLLEQVTVDQEDRRLLDEFCAEWRANQGTARAQESEDRGHE